MSDEVSPYFSGEKLYGDDFSQEQIDDWFADEAEGYAGLGARDRARYSYGYHQLNRQHAFRFLANRRFAKALGIGSAYGDEFMPIAGAVSHITILDPSDAFAEVKEIQGVPCAYRKPSPDGRIAFEDKHFDLITSLGVMHHIPNVSFVLSECRRCLTDNGIMLLREPITSMGDWRKPRIGLTKRERGIPLQILDRIIEDCGFKVVRRSLCNFPLLPKIANRFGIAPYNSTVITMADSLCSKTFSWNIRYHRTRLAEKLAPASAYFVLTK